MLKQRHVLGTGPVLALTVVLVGSYAGNWNWTGFSSNGSLWDWLHLLVLPVVVATLPLWFDTRPARRLQRRWFLVALAVAFAVVTVGGYGFGWQWTGFQGNTLWDWLQLLLVPVVLPIAVFVMSKKEEDKEQPAAAALPDDAAGQTPLAARTRSLTTLDEPPGGMVTP